MESSEKKKSLSPLKTMGGLFTIFLPTILIGWILFYWKIKNLKNYLFLKQWINSL